MELQPATWWRPRLLQVLIGTPVLLLALVASLAFSGGIAYASNSTDISTDPFTQATCAASNTTNHHTEVEPDTFSFGSTIVAAYQVGRIYDGGACAIGFATSTNNGSTWTTGLLRGITKWTVSQGTGPYARATDPAVAYDPKHSTWMVSTLAITETGGVKGVAVVTSLSTDGGFTWGNPVVTASVTGKQSFDKNWITCDTTASSPHYGNCYTEWDDNGNGNLLKMSTSTDGGHTWSAAATNGSGVIGGQPVVRPDGTVIVPIDNANATAVGAFNSTNGGASWSAITTITTINHHTVAGSLREDPLPSAEVDGAGTVYVAWSDCRFRSRCSQNDIVITHSTNATGTTWATITRVPIDATNSGIDHFIPGLTVNKATSGSTAQLGVTYYFYASGSTSLQVGFISSTNAGSTWSTPTTIFGGSSAFPTTWVSTTSQGRMVGDYVSTSYGTDNLAHGVYAVAYAPTTGSGTSCSTTALDNCNEPTDAFATGLLAGTTVAPSGPILSPPPKGGSHKHIWGTHHVEGDL
jgi:hypothetical protein